MDLLSTVVVLAMTSTAVQTDEPRATSRGAPWQAQIYSTYDGYSAEERAAKPLWELAHRCGGSLIAPDWVLTAAHCIDQAQVNQGWRVRLGTRDLGQGDGVTYRIGRMVRHAGYDPRTHVHDIALVHLVADEQTDESLAGPVEPIRLNGTQEGDTPVVAGTPVTVSGFGKTAPGPDGRHSMILMQADVEVVDCADVAAYRGRTTPGMICAGADNADSCQGDSGGPLVRTFGEPVLVGVVSWGDGCADRSRPGVYVRVDGQHYLEWIQRAMAADPSITRLN